MRTSAKVLDGIEVVARGADAIAFWSEPAGLFARRLDSGGTPRAAPQRLGARCEGGLDARADGAAVVVACLVHPLRDKPDAPGGVLVLRVRADLSLEHTRMLGPAGDLSEGVALAQGRHGLELAWHDGSPLAQRVWWTELGDAGAVPKVVSDSTRVAATPAMTSLDGQTALAWTETWVERGELQGRLAFWDHAAAARTLRAMTHAGAMPQLFPLGGSLVLGFRDVSKGSKTGLYLARVLDRGARIGEPIRLGRADGIARPALEPCMHGVVTATPRTFAGDYFVGVNWLDTSLQRARGEQQFYEDSRAFTQVAVSCAGDHALLLIAEFPQLQRSSSALRAVPYQCR